jgi:proteasome lid subunit RPN8/RPN11
MGDEILTFTGRLWRTCMAELRRRGRGLTESGCFVLGKIEGKKRRAVRCVYYDDLDSKAYSSGVCILEGSAFSPLWEICRAEGLTVLADIHTHEGEAFQSRADRENPMIARPGHLAVIVPLFARGPVWRHRLGYFRYEGDHRWTDLSGWRARARLKTGWSLI